METEERIAALDATAEWVPFGFLTVRDLACGGHIIQVNSRLWSACGCASKDAFLAYTGALFVNLVHPDDRKGVLSRLRAPREADPSRHLYYRILARDGSHIHVEDTCMPVDDGETCVHYLALSDRNRNQNVFDLVTGLHEKHYLYTWISEQYRYNKESFDDHPLAVLYLNCRGFRHYNEVHGYAGGDLLLQELGKEIERCCSTTMATRLYGDRFVVFCNALHAEDAVRALHAWVGKTYGLSLVAGVCHPADLSVAPEVLADRAKLACDRVPQGSRECFAVYTDELARAIRMKEYIQTHMDEAVARGWLQVYLQPIVRTLTGRICGVEALARWNDPVYGAIAPGVFVPALEERGLSYKLARFVIDRSAAAVEESMQAALPVCPVSINFSRRDFDMIDPNAEIAQALERHRLPHGMLVAEITESMAMEDAERIHAAIGKFHAQGCEVWMDDFGSAYSSLNSLKDFAFDVIKMDMAFLRDLNDRARKIIENCIAMAKDLGIHTLCEGVETAGQLRFLRDAGCEKIQGYYCSRPRAPEEFRTLLQDRVMVVERPEERRLYDAAGSLPFVKDALWALFLGEDRSWRTVYGSVPLREEAARRGYEGLAAGNLLQPGRDGYAERICGLLDKAAGTGEEMEVSFFSDGRSYAAAARTVASEAGRHLCLLRIRDTTDESRQLMLTEAGGVTRSFLAEFDGLYMLDTRRKELQVVASELPRVKSANLLTYADRYPDSFLHEEDRDRFQAWLGSGVEQCGRGSVGMFRFLQCDGRYAWMTVVLVPYAEHAGRFLVCLRPEALSFAPPAFPAAKEKV